MKSNPKILVVSGFRFLCTGFMAASAQPSGGPYGPIQHTYRLPKGDGKLYYVAVDGSADQSGESLANPTSLESCS